MRQRKLLIKGILSCLALAIIFILWGALFFYLEELPFQKLRPWTIPSLLMNAYQFDFLTNLFLFLPVIVSVIVAFLAGIALLAKPSFSQIYGNAHWAKNHEIKKAGFFDEAEGNIVVGRFSRQKMLHYKLVNHMMVFAPSRSGKGVSVVIPNALMWQGSLLVTDNKSEVYEFTSGYRKAQGQEVYRFSPASRHEKTHRINPLDYVSKDNLSKAITDLHLILDILIKSGDGDNHMWVEEARSIALGVLLWLRQSDRPFTLGELSSIVKGGEDLVEFLEKIIETSVVADQLITLPHAAFLAIQNYLQKAPKEQSGVRSTLTSMLRLWEDPMICAATSCSDLDFRNMRRQKTTLYLSFGTNQITRLAPLINMIVQLFLNVMLEYLPDEDEPHKVLCLLDEINRFGRMDKLKDGFGDLAGYGVHLMPIIQNVGQFFSTYQSRDASDIFFQNTDLKIGFRQNAQTDKELLSKELGNRTIRLRTRSRTTNKSGYSINESYIERPLLSAKEVGSFDTDKQIIITGDLSIKARKICYFKEPFFKSRILPPIEIPSVFPEYPIINIKKKAPEYIDSETKSSARPMSLTLDKETGEILNGLAAAFEDHD